MTSWSVLTSHARLLLCIARDPGMRLRDIAAGPGSTERSAYGIITDLTTAGYAAKQEDGRRNRYQRLRPRTPRRSWRMTGTSARMRPEAGKGLHRHRRGLACCQAASAHAPVTRAGGSRSRLCWAAVA